MFCSQILASAFTLSSPAALQSVAVASGDAEFPVSAVLAVVTVLAVFAASPSLALAGAWVESGCAAGTVLSAGAGGDCGGCAAGACVPSSSRFSNCEPFAWSELGAPRAGFGSVGLNEYVVTSDAT